MAATVTALRRGWLFLPLADRDLTLHIGGYGTWRVPEMSGKTERFVEFRTFPESRTDRRRFVRAEIFNVKSYYTVGAELAFRWRKLLVYGEYIFTELSRYGLSGGERIPLKNASFNGWYATASYMLRGEQRRYAPEDAEFGPMEVRRGGNLELAVRASNINMNDFHDARAVITGGAATKLFRVAELVPEPERTDRIELYLHGQRQVCRRQGTHHSRREPGSVRCFLRGSTSASCSCVCCCRSDTENFINRQIRA